ncbi:MAG: hypothetical protein ACO3B7_04545 [Candidatus Limnocylindrus sp.]
MMIQTAHFAIGTTSVQIATPDDNPQIVIIHDHDHTSSDDVFIGGPDVTIANGLHLPKTETITVHLDAGDSLYAVADGGSIEVHVLQTKR